MLSRVASRMAAPQNESSMPAVHFAFLTYQETCIQSLKRWMLAARTAVRTRTLWAPASARPVWTLDTAAQPGSVPYDIVMTFISGFNAAAGNEVKREHPLIGNEQERQKQWCAAACSQEAPCREGARADSGGRRRADAVDRVLARRAQRPGQRQRPALPVLPDHTGRAERAARRDDAELPTPS